MEYVQTKDLDVDNGLQAVAGGENPGQISEGMRRAGNMLGRLKEKDNDRTLLE